MIIVLFLKGVLLVETKNKFSEFNLFCKYLIADKRKILINKRKNINNITKISNNPVNISTPHALAQRHLKEGWFANLWDVSDEIDSDTSLRSLRFSQRRLWIVSETVILCFQTEAFFGYLLIYWCVSKYFSKLI